MEFSSHVLKEKFSLVYLSWCLCVGESSFVKEGGGIYIDACEVGAVAVFTISPRSNSPKVYVLETLVT